MDSLDALYSAQAAVAAAQATQTTSAASKTEDTTFNDMLNSLTGTGSDTTGQWQRQLFSGLADGTINVTDGQALVTALLGTLNSESDFSSLSNLSSLDTLTELSNSGVSQDVIASLLDLNQDLEGKWVEQIVKAFSEEEADSTVEEVDNSLQSYYEAMAALAQAQQGLLDD